MPNLKAFVRIDGTGRVVPGTLLLRYKKPGVGKWMEIDATECCNNNIIVNPYVFQYAISNICVGRATLITIWATESCVFNPQVGCEFWGDENLTTPAPDGQYLVTLPGNVRGYAILVNGVMTLVEPCP